MEVDQSLILFEEPTVSVFKNKAADILLDAVEAKEQVLIEYLEVVRRPGTLL